jgi:hypothetical protein
MAHVLLAVLLCLGATSAHAGAPSAEQSFEHLRALVGTWTAPVSEGKEIRLTYRLISGGSTLVETYTLPSGKETLTLYHLDGTRLLATHYCAQGNQPRLRLAPGATEKRWLFTFVDVTNLKSPRASRLHRMELTLGDADHFTKVETYRSNGKDETDTLNFTRVPVASGT